MARMRYGAPARVRDHAASDSPVASPISLSVKASSFGTILVPEPRFVALAMTLERPAAIAAMTVGNRVAAHAVDLGAAARSLYQQRLARRVPWVCSASRAGPTRVLL